MAIKTETMGLKNEGSDQLANSRVRKALRSCIGPSMSPSRGGRGTQTPSAMDLERQRYHNNGFAELHDANQVLD